MKNKIKLHGSTMLLLYLFSMIFLISGLVLINATENSSEVDEESNVKPKSNQSGKTILFDESHVPKWDLTHDNMMQNLSADLASEGYNIDNMTTWNANQVLQADVIIISTNTLEYTDAEFYTLHNFVTKGGGLFIIGNYGTIEYWDELAFRFGVTFSPNLLTDSDDFENNIAYVNFTDPSNFGNHPITDGISEVQMLSGSGLTKIPLNAIPLIMMDADQNSSYSGGGLSSGIPTLVAFDYQYGYGRIVVRGDIAIFSNYDYFPDEKAQYERLDNAQLAKNIINWLSTPDIPDKIVVFDESHDPWVFLGPDLRMGVVPTVINVLFDETHSSWAHIDNDDDGIYGSADDGSGYGDFAAILEGASFIVNKMNTWSGLSISLHDVVVMDNPQDVYIESEINSIQTYVRDGGSLCIIGEGGNYLTPAITELIQAFGADVYDGTLYDEDDYDISHDPSYIIFNETNLADHPIMNGITNLEFIHAAAFNVTPSNAIPLVKSDNDDTALWRADNFPEGNPSAQNLPCAIAFTYGKGRVVISLDHSMFVNVPSLYDFLPKEDNSLYGINTIRWLGEAGYYYSDYYDMKGYLEDAGYGVQVMLDYDLEFYSDASTLIIAPPQIEYSVDERLEIKEYVETGGGLLLISDHLTWAGYSNDLLELFDFNGVGLDTAVDVSLYDLNDYMTNDDEGHIIFDADNFEEHPILTDINEIYYPVGTGFDIVPLDADILIKMDDDISAEWSNGTSAVGVPAMIAVEREEGRLIVIGDGSLWRNSLITATEGFNNETIYIDLFDNKLLLLNTIEWLADETASSLIDTILEFITNNLLYVSIAGAALLIIIISAIIIGKKKKKKKKGR